MANGTINFVDLYNANNNSMYEKKKNLLCTYRYLSRIYNYFGSKHLFSAEKVIEWKVIQRLYLSLSPKIVTYIAFHKCAPLLYIFPIGHVLLVWKSGKIDIKYFKSLVIIIIIDIVIIFVCIYFRFVKHF